MAYIHRSIDEQATLERRMSIVVSRKAFLEDLELREASEELRKVAKGCEKLRKLAKTCSRRKINFQRISVGST